jgi:ubiquinone/menaquinone biosynthesis C-methylase UbiE
MERDAGRGFSEVDSSGRVTDLVDYLDHVSTSFADRRRLNLQRLGLTLGGAVLDAGCGVGEICIELRRLVGSEGRVVGIDASSEMIRTARERSAETGIDVEFDVADIANLPFMTRRLMRVGPSGCCSM